jgi:hypothetical protein
MPGYHDYDLAAAEVDALAERAAGDGVVLAVHLRAEDERMQNPIALVPGAPFDEVVSLANRHPDLRVVTFGLARLHELAGFAPDGLQGRLNAPAASEPLATLPENLWLDLSFFEYESSLAMATKLVRTDRLLFATHFPLFYPRCNILKVRNSEVAADVKSAVTTENAEALLGVS